MFNYLLCVHCSFRVPFTVAYLLLGTCTLKKRWIYYIPIAPDAAPQSVMFQHDRHSPEMVFFSWEPPPPDQQNGLITRYDIVCTPSSGSGELLNGMSNGALNATVGMFTPATQYSCTITASTSVGTGPGISVTVVTCELIELTFVFHCYCISWLLKLLQPLQEYEPEWVPHH